MFKWFGLFAVALLTTTSLARAGCDECVGERASAASPAIKQQRSASVAAEELLDELGMWLVSHFDLPAVQERPAIVLVSDAYLLAKRLHSSVSQGAAYGATYTDPGQRRAVALYDDAQKSIFLAEGWVGQSAADKSILVHEMVHHIQNLAKMKYECPMAREKLAYMAQDKWLAQFGLSLEQEFEVDMFTIVVSSACVY
jgi:hypothetical protein